MRCSIQIVIVLVLNSASRRIYEVSSTTNNDWFIVSPEVVIHQGQTTEQYVKDIIDFWTEDRIQQAIPKPLPEINSLPIDEINSNSASSDEENRIPTVIQGTLPISSSTSIARRAGYPNTVGKVYFVDGGSYYTCSASVVTASNKDLIFTAGHCVYSSTNSAFVSYFIFIPQYDNNTRPYGTWVARSLRAMSNWAYYTDYNYDVAIVLLYTSNGQHIQDVVGSQSVGFYYGHSATVYSFGYPSNYFNTEIMTYCTATKYFANFSSYTGDAMSCIMNQGCSGGPWFESFSFGSLSGIQTSVNSFTRTSTPNVMYGPYFGSSVQSMYTRAEADTGTTQSGSAHSFNFSTILFLLFGLFQLCFQNSFFLIFLS